MITEKDNGKIQTQGLDSSSGFKINATAKAFAILSSGLYSNKIRAVIRELSCNAYDSHKAAGNEARPFKVTLPTHFDNIFCVQDFGLGLSEEQVFNLYTTYFESTKTQSNDYIGALGLGSKSPFSYTTSFSVISNFEGKKTTYLAFLGDQGFPSISKVSEVETTEENGISVSFSVKTADMDKFQYEAQQVFSTFPLQPILVGYKSSLDAIPVKYNTSSVFTTKVMYRSNYRDAGFRIIQGNIPYPLTFDNFDKSIFSNKFKSKMSLDKVVDLFKRLSGMPIDITVPIGTCDIAASRESLSYDKQTIANLAEVIIGFMNELHDHFYNIVAKEKTLISQAIKYGELIVALGNEFKTNAGWNYNPFHNLMYIFNEGNYNFGLGNIFEGSTVDSFHGTLKHQFPIGLSGHDIYAWDTYDFVNAKSRRATRYLQYSGSQHTANHNKNSVTVDYTKPFTLVMCNSKNWQSALLHYIANTTPKPNLGKIYACFVDNGLGIRKNPVIDNKPQFNDRYLGLIKKLDHESKVIFTSDIVMPVTPKTARSNLKKTDFKINTVVMSGEDSLTAYLQDRNNRYHSSKPRSKLYTDEIEFENVVLNTKYTKHYYLVAGKGTESGRTTYKEIVLADGTTGRVGEWGCRQYSDVIEFLNIDKQTVICVVDQKNEEYIKELGFKILWDSMIETVEKEYAQAHRKIIMNNAVKRAIDEYSTKSNLAPHLYQYFANHYGDIEKTVQEIKKHIPVESKEFTDSLDRITNRVRKIYSIHDNPKNKLFTHQIVQRVIKDHYKNDEQLIERRAIKIKKFIESFMNRYGTILLLNNNLVRSTVGRDIVKNYLKQLGEI